MKNEQKITFLVYQWVKRPAQKPIFFVPKSCISTRKIASKSFIYTPGIDFFWTVFLNSINHAKIIKKHNALIRLLRKNHSKSLFFFIKATHFHAKKHRNLAKKIIPAHANGQACDRTFSWWKIKKKIKINAQKYWKTQSFNTFGAKMFIICVPNHVFLMHFHHQKF